MPSSHLPDLTFPNLRFGPHEFPWDLRPWLYKGGAQAHRRDVATMINSGNLGHALVERVELVRRIHEVFQDYLEGGGRRSTVEGRIDRLAQFFRWADEAEDRHLTLGTAENLYRCWCDALLQRVRVVRDLKLRTANGYGAGVGWILDKVLGRTKPLVRSTRLHQPRASSRAVSPKNDKQNLEETFAFGHFLLDLSDGLDQDAIWGPLPLRLPLRSGQSLELTSGLRRLAVLKPPNPRWPSQSRQAARRVAESRAAWEAEKSHRTRSPLINLRIQAEMFMLMAQPAVNLAQAFQLRMDQWRFKPSINGYEIRTFKHRRGGPVEFEVYGEYRAIFERYLRWRKSIFSSDSDGLLFPLLGRNGQQPQRRPDRPPRFTALKEACERAGVKYLSPSALRNTNVNWMLRRTQDPDLTAAVKQHTKQTLLAAYEKPSLQRALVQTHLFWELHDPALAAAGPGTCTGKVPEPVAGIPISATRPDCKTPAGCLFCAYHRDIDSFDHVWSLASYRLLKSFELNIQAQAKSKRVQPQHPTEAAIARITDKLTSIESSTPERSKWVQEAQIRLEEGRYHSLWAGLIESLCVTAKDNTP